MAVKVWVVVFVIALYSLIGGYHISEVHAIRLHSVITQETLRWLIVLGYIERK